MKTMIFRLLNAAFWGALFASILTHSILTWDTTHELFWRIFITKHLFFAFLLTAMAFVFDKGIRETAERFKNKKSLLELIKRIKHSGN